MSQVDIVSGLAATYCKVESTFGSTPGSMTRVFPVGMVSVSPTQTIIATDTQQVKFVNRDKSVRGLKTCTAKLTCDAYIDNNRANSAATPAQHWLGAMIKAILGGESMPAGSTIAAGSTSSAINAAVGHGTRFPVGQVALCDVGDTPEVIIIKAVAADTLTPLFNLSGSPTTGQDIFNTHSYHLTDTNTQSLSLQLALAQDSNHQWTLNGLTGGISLSITRNERVQYSFDLRGTTFTGPSAQSVSTAVGTNSLSGPVPNRDAVCYLQSLSTTTRTHVPFHEISVTIDSAMDHVTELGGATEGVIGTMRTKKDNASSLVSAELTIRTDTARQTDWDNDTDYVLVYAIPRGTGASKQWWGFVIYCNIEGRPDPVVVDGRQMMKLSLKGRQNTMQSTVTTDLANSPIVIFEG